MYTIWSRNRLIGETDLGFIMRENRYRTGWFHPNELGERLMPAATGVPPAMRFEFTLGSDQTAHADVLAAIDREHALEFELRGPNGKVIETETIAIIDTHYLLELADVGDKNMADDDFELTPEQEAEIDAMVAEWDDAHSEVDQAIAEAQEVALPRYQVQ